MKRAFFGGLVLSLFTLGWTGEKPLPPASAEEARSVGLLTNWEVEPAGVEGRPVFNWRMASRRRGSAQRAYRIRLFPAEAPLKVLWDTGRVQSGDSVAIPYGGPALSPARRYRWEVTVEDERGRWLAPAQADFETGLDREQGWKGSEWITPAVKRGRITTAAFCRGYQNIKVVKSAHWFVTGCGVFEAFVNGQPVTRKLASGQEIRPLLKPGFTGVTQCRHAFSYDITRQIRCGKGERNIFSAWVSRGWWSDAITRHSGKESAFRAQLLFRYEDGTEAWMGTGRDWLATYTGPLIDSGIYEGEIYDARIGREWMKNGRVGKGWQPARVSDAFKGEIRSAKGPPITLRRDLERLPKEIYVFAGTEQVREGQYGVVKILRRYRDGEPIELNPGESLVVDFGQNASGRPRFTLRGEAGTEITVRHAEMLNDRLGLKGRGNDGPEGSLYLRNLRGIFAGLRYTVGGVPNEEYAPEFTFFGFRYLGMTTSGKVVISRIRGEVLTSVPEGADRGRVTCSDGRVNQLLSNIRWTLYSNLLSVPTDCPQRNERLGWGGDAQIISRTAAFHADVYRFFAKWLDDMRDQQRADGAFPSAVPLGVYGRDYGVSGWADAGIIVPYRMYTLYGDRTILQENYEAMSRYMAFVHLHLRDKNCRYGDWLAYERNDLAIRLYLQNCYAVWCARIMAEVARVVGRAEDVSRFTAMERDASTLFRERYLEEDGSIRKQYWCQSAAVYALYLGLNPTPRSAEATLKGLLESIRAAGNRLRTGLLGTSLLMETLTKAGAEEIAYTLLLQRGNPSWLFMVDQGATTIWERWNSYDLKRGFGNANMNSFNHYAFGVVGSWIFRTMAGIREDPRAPGFRHVILAPVPDRRVRKVEATYDSAYGPIESGWAYGERGWSGRFSLPANTTATLILPPGVRSVNGRVLEELTLERDGAELSAGEGKRALRLVAGSYVLAEGEAPTR